jgi:imidazolonepropionase-like amidohydrolase
MLLALLAGVLLATAAPDSIIYPVINHGRAAGSMVVRHRADTTTVRYVFTDRNRGTRLVATYIVRNGRIVSSELRPVRADETVGDRTVRIDVMGDSLKRSGPIQSVTSALRRDAWVSLNATPYEQLLLARHLLRQPDKRLITADGDTVELTVLRTLTVPTATRREMVRLVSLHRTRSRYAQYLWLDAANDLFATEVGWFMTHRAGALPALPALRRVELALRGAEGEALNRRVAATTSGTIVIRNGDLFDSETGAVRPRTTVVVRGSRIVAVGPADSVATPAGATVIDATGKAVMPGMWEMHGHVQLVSQVSGSPAQLSRGITTTRDMAADEDVAVDQRDREQAGRLAAPRSVLAGFMEGPLKWAGPSATLVSTEAESRAWVAKYDSMGYKQIKVYNVLHPDLIPTIAAEAHRRGMRLSGHIPRGLTVDAAVRLGFDEINHAAFLFSTFYQDSLYVPTMRAYSAVASAVAPNIDVDGAPMTALIALLKEKGTVIDGTFSVWIQSAGTSVATAVGAPATGDVGKADANYLRLIKRLYDAGVTMLPGTDAFGSPSYVAELEQYVRAGVPAPVVLQMATIIPARVMKDDRAYGSVSVGKVADIIVVAGTPWERVADLRNVEQVVRGGRLYNVTVLKKAIGN